MLRVAAMGESTTQGHDVDLGSYPTYLRSRLAASARGYAGVEMINGGVLGWISEQVAVRAEHQIAAFKPDIVVLYVGWNDFQAYDPTDVPRKTSTFEAYHGGTPLHAYAAATFKSVALLTSAYQRLRATTESVAAARGTHEAGPEQIYRFCLANLDRVVVACRRANPPVQICISTLAGRWPLDSAEDFVKQAGRTLVDEASQPDAGGRG